MHVFIGMLFFQVKNLVYGLVLAKRQLVTVIRMKGVALNPCDLHLLINLIDCNPSLKNADNWIPICLPQFNDTYVHPCIACFFVSQLFFFFFFVQQVF